ncbi:hypothetical protein [Streptomyces sp. NPDC005795]|uniref:hypothetical protein n=1 Tax=Streptomyces sp. NPDC005795 TaxID=3154677 RepID=UPI00340FC323
MYADNGHLKPVLLRDRDPQYFTWEGTIWHDMRSDDLMKKQVEKMHRTLEGGVPLTSGEPGDK